MNLQEKILAVLQVPLVYPQIENLIYPEGRPRDYAGQITLGLALIRMVNRKKLYYRESHSVRLRDSEQSTTGMTWPVYCLHPIPRHLKIPTYRDLKSNP